MSESAAFKDIPFDDDADEVKTWKGLALSAIMDLRRYAHDAGPERRMVSAEAYEADAERIHAHAPEPTPDALEAANRRAEHYKHKKEIVATSRNRIAEGMEYWRERALLAESKMASPSTATTDEAVAHKIMTDEEYTSLRIKGWHLVCKDYHDEPGCVAIQYTPPAPVTAFCRHCRDEVSTIQCCEACGGELESHLIAAPSPSAAMTDWVNCPICDEPDMRQETDSEGFRIIHCVNHSCASNGGPPATPTPSDAMTTNPPATDAVREAHRADLAEKHLNQIYDFLDCCRSGSAAIRTIKDREAALSSAPVAGADGIASEARFLLDRLEELDDANDEDYVRKFEGHVRPPMSRLRRLLPRNDRGGQS